MSDDGGLVVVVERIEPGEPRPDYCIHGRATCYICDEWCWLGEQTYTLVSTGTATPMCLQCATRILPAGIPRLYNAKDPKPDEEH